MVPGSCQRRDDYYHEPRYARPRLLASTGAAEGELRTGRQRPGDKGPSLISACDSDCDKARTERVGGGPLPLATSAQRPSFPRR